MLKYLEISPFSLIFLYQDIRAIFLKKVGDSKFDNYQHHATLQLCAQSPNLSLEPH